MKKLNTLEKNKIKGGVTFLGVIQGTVAIIYTIGEILNFSASWIPERKRPFVQNNYETKNFVNRNDGNQITIFS